MKPDKVELDSIYDKNQGDLASRYQYKYLVAKSTRIHFTHYPQSKVLAENRSYGLAKVILGLTVLDVKP